MKQGAEARDALTFRHPNWFGPVGEEARAARTSAGLFETSIYGKFSGNYSPHVGSSIGDALRAERAAPQ